MGKGAAVTAEVAKEEGVAAKVATAVAAATAALVAATAAMAAMAATSATSASPRQPSPRPSISARAASCAAGGSSAA